MCSIGVDARIDGRRHASTDVDALDLNGPLSTVNTAYGGTSVNGVLGLWSGRGLVSLTLSTRGKWREGETPNTAEYTSTKRHENKLKRCRIYTNIIKSSTLDSFTVRTFTELVQ